MLPIKQLLCKHTLSKETNFKCIKCGYIISLNVQRLIKEKEKVKE